MEYARLVLLMTMVINGAVTVLPHGIGDREELRGPLHPAYE
jgi:hypothetical protein